MSAWGVRYDWLHKSLYDLKRLVPGYADQWVKQMAAVSTSSTEKELDAAIPLLMKDLGNGWQNSFLDALKNAQRGTLETTLEQQLDSLIDAMATRDPAFMTEVQRAQNAVLASFAHMTRFCKNSNRRTSAQNSIRGTRWASRACLMSA